MLSSIPAFGSILLISILLFAGVQKPATAFVVVVSSSAHSWNKIGRSSTTILKAQDKSRRNFLVSVLSTSAVLLPNQAKAAGPKTRYVLDDETGDYVEVQDDGNWQKEWKSRYDQMSKMSKDEIFVAARGAGNIDSKDLANESPASKKRRAFSGCRDKGTRAKLGNIDEKSCSKRVLEGDYEFVLEAL